MVYHTLPTIPAPVVAQDTKIYYWALYLLLLLVYLPGLFVPLMDNDSAHHANIGLRMYLDGNYAFLIDRGEPYLDKPHLLFWTSALSYHLFGVNAFAYKFPSFLFTILGTYSTYRLGWLLYTKETGKLAALIVATAFAYVLAATDVRMDAMLTASAIFALWQLCAYVAHRKNIHLVLAALGLALGFATKGWVGAVVPAIALLIHLLYKRNWPMLFHWKWTLLILLFFVFISPVLYAYYLQYDLHPELEVRGQNGVSGVRFILWDQNFERMQGESFNTKKRDFTFFLHTFLWAFAPWSLLYVFALIGRAKTFVQTRFRSRSDLEFMTLGAALFFVTLFSLSSFKLPHYLNILFPLFALLLAGYLCESRNNPGRLKTFWRVQLFVCSMMALIAIALNVWAFPFQSGGVMVVSGLLFVLWLSILFLKLNLTQRIVYFSVTGLAFMFFMINANFYPQLLTYQAGTTLPRLTAGKNIDDRTVFIYQTDHSFSYDFNTAYLHQAITLEEIENLKQRHQHLWVTTDAEGLANLQQKGFTFRQQYRVKDYHITKLKGNFLHPYTRPEAIKYVYLVLL